MKRVAALLLLILVVGCGPKNPITKPTCPGVCADGNHVEVHGTVYEIADGNRPGCFQMSPDSDILTYFQSLRDYLGGGVEQACP
jgi:hypothetical protein